MTAFLAALLGAVLVLSFAPFDWWPLSFVAAGGLFHLAETYPDRLRAIALGFGIGKWGVGTSWVYVSINVYGNAAPPLAAFLVALMVLILTAFVLLQFWLYGRLRKAGALAANAVLFTALWVAFEWVMTWALSGFPWLFAGYSQLRSPLLGFAPVGGVLLASLAVVSIGVAGVVALRSAGTLRFGAAGFALLVGVMGYLLGLVQWTTTGPVRSVALVQGNTDQATKWRPEQRQAIVRRHIELTDPHWDTDLVVWPEAAITSPMHQAEPLLAGLDRRGRATATTVVSGIPSIEPVEDGYGYFNAAVAVGLGEGTYLKQHLVPFGEYVPFEAMLRGAIDFFDLPMSALHEGPSGQALLDLGGFSGAMLICYEVAFADLTRRTAQDAEVLLTISNDTWFGASIGPAQHLQIAQMRAAETGRWLLRATNNGITAVVNGSGQVVERLPQFEAAVLRSSFPLIQGQTPYQRFGDSPVVIALVALLLWRMVRRYAAQ